MRSKQQRGVQGDLLAPSLTEWTPEAWAIAPDWRATTDSFFAHTAGRHLAGQIQARLAVGATIYPPQPLRALALTPLHAIKVVLLGQDPYHGPGQANGLAFSVASGVPAPPSLRNIQAEIARDRACGALGSSLPVGLKCSGLTEGHDEIEGIERVDGPQARSDGDLTRWARQGVLLLNTCLTVEQGQSASHSNFGWEVLTGAIIAAISANSGPVAFMLWGRHAQDHGIASMQATANGPRLHLRCNHPSPLSARRAPLPFVGCGHFGQVNAFLRQHGVSPIDW